MAVNLIKNLTARSNFQRLMPLCLNPRIAQFSSSTDLEKAKKIKEAPQKDVDVALMSSAEEQHRKDLMGKISVDEQADVSPLTGVPDEHIHSRRVRIYMPPKNSMQSGTDNTHGWEIEFDNRQRWENPLIGWVSSGDPLSNMKVEFKSKEDAAEFCERNGWKWYVDANEPKQKVAKPYALNFHWSRKTRVSTK